MNERINSQDLVGPESAEGSTFSQETHSALHEQLAPHADDITNIIDRQITNAEIAQDPDLRKASANERDTRSNQKAITQILDRLSQEGITEGHVDYYRAAKDLQSVESTINNINGAMSRGDGHPDDPDALAAATSKRDSLRETLTRAQVELAV